MSFSSRAVVLCLAALSSSLLPLAASAQVPALINYQGRLLDGTNLVNGSVGLSLRLFDAAAAGTLLYEDSNTVTVADGLYSTLIGDGTTFSTLQSALENMNVWIEAAVNNTALTPRERLVSAAYAVKSRATEFFTGAVADSQLSANIARLNGTNQTFSGPVAFTSVSNTFNGTFSGDGLGVTNVNLASIAIPGYPAHLTPVVAWGRSAEGQRTAPGTATGLVAIAGGYDHTMALRSDGTVLAWGAGTNDLNDGVHEGQSIVPATATNVVAIAGGAYHSLALRGDGTVIAWGKGSAGQTNVPASATGVVAIAAGADHSLALRGDGMVLAWGFNLHGQTNVPASATGVVAIAGGADHSLALRGDGAVIAWGKGGAGQTNVPATATGVVAIAAGAEHNLALRDNGTVVAWGLNTDGQTTVPATATNVAAVAAGGRHSLALRAGRLPAQIALLDRNNTFAGTVSASSFTGNGAGLTNVGTSSLAVDVLTNISARLSSNVWAAADASRIAADGALSNSVASLQTNVAARLSSNVWAAADAARIGAEGALSNSVASLQTNVATRLSSNVWAAADASLQTNIAARLFSNVWAVAQTNLAVRSGTNVFVGANTFTGTTTVVGTFLGSPPYIKVAETQVVGVAGGANAAGTNNFRNLNAELIDTHGLASLSGGDITLPAGTYFCRIAAPAYRVDENQARLRTATGTVLLYGTSTYSDSTLSPSVQTYSLIDGQFTLGATSTLHIQHYMKTVRNPNGLGVPASATWGDGAPYEVYTFAEFWKVK